MEVDNIINMRMNFGKFLHIYYKKFGESKYNLFVEKMGRKLSKRYGSAFNPDSLRIMEAEYVTLSKKIRGSK